MENLESLKNLENLSPNEILCEEFTNSEIATSLRVCYNCSTCSTICPVALETVGKFNPRLIIQLANCEYENRLTEDLSPNVWDCAMCELCQEECPEGVDLHETFILLKNTSAQLHHAPDSYTLETNQVYNHGKAVLITAVMAKRRKQLGLPVSPKIDEKEIQKLMNLTPVKDILDYEEKRRAAEKAKAETENEKEEK